jgi:SAM-dependent methyltransferase
MTDPCERYGGVSIAQRLAREMPWGLRFAARCNFEDGYFSVERYLVSKYLNKPSTVLVFGSGNGREARPIATHGHRIVCFDIGFLYVRSGHILSIREGLKDIYFLQADMYGLPFASETFDFIFFSIYASAGKRRFGVLCQVRDLLRPGGMVTLMIPTPLYPKLHPGLPTPDTIVLTDEEMTEEIVRIERCRFRFLESSVDPIRNEYRTAVFEAC